MKYSAITLLISSSAALSLQKVSIDDDKSEWDVGHVEPGSAEEDIHGIWLHKRQNTQRPGGLILAQNRWIQPDPADATATIHKPDSDPDQLLSSWRLHQQNN